MTTDKPSGETVQKFLLASPPSMLADYLVQVQTRLSQETLYPSTIDALRVAILEALAILRPLFGPTAMEALQMDKMILEARVKTLEEENYALRLTVDGL